MSIAGLFTASNFSKLNQMGLTLAANLMLNKAEAKRTRNQRLLVSIAVNTIGQFQSIRDGTTMVSEGGVFEFGFFSLGNSKNRYVGIWYRNIPVRTVVWVANRCNPINGFSGLLTINGTGNLVVLNHNKSVVWSTSSSKQAKKPLVQLLDSGNLILRDEEVENLETNYLWQSFDHPSDTILPEMKFGWDLRTGLNWKLSAWKDWDDPCPGDSSFVLVAHDNYPEAYVRKGTTIYYRSGPWNGVGFSGAPDLGPNQLFDYHYVYNGIDMYSRFSLKNRSIISIIVLNETNNICQRLVWMEGERRWRSYVSSPRDDCDHYGHCGANGKCVISETAVCQCLEGFKPKSPEKWDLWDWSEGCVRKYPLNCKDGDKDKEIFSADDDFVKLDGVKMPDTRNSSVNESMNLKECRVKCLSDCSCVAYSNCDIRGEGKGCRIWYGDLMDIRQISASEQELYIRIPALELENRRRDKKATQKNRAKVQDSELSLFSLATISAATDNFSLKNKLGEGGFGPVYKGTLADGQEIAVKRLSLSSQQGITELENEVMLVAKLQHRNLIKLLGCCIHEEEKLLVYEYMPNKSLDAVIF
ncbi:hypothetical protein TIFTF001_049311, partial [Ficus carica]